MISLRSAAAVLPLLMVTACGSGTPSAAPSTARHTPPDPCSLVGAPLAGELVGVEKGLPDEPESDGRQCTWKADKATGQLIVHVGEQMNQLPNDDTYAAAKQAYLGRAVGEKCHEFASEVDQSCWLPRADGQLVIMREKHAVVLVSLVSPKLARTDADRAKLAERLVAEAAPKL